MLCGRDVSTLWYYKSTLLLSVNGASEVLWMERSIADFQALRFKSNTICICGMFYYGAVPLIRVFQAQTVLARLNKSLI